MITSPTGFIQQHERDSPANQANFRQQLKDAITEIQIEPDLTIVHADYEPLIVSDRYRDYLQQVSKPERDRYLTIQLQRYLYAIFTDSLRSKSDLKTTSDSESNDPTSEITNNADRWYETPFFSRLVQNNHGRGYSDSGWQIVGQKSGRWQAVKDGLTLYIDPEKHLFDRNQLQIGQTVAIKMPPSLIDHEVYIAVGDAGSSNFETASESDCTILQLYFNVDSELALLLLDSLTLKLNSLKIPFDFKIAYREESFEGFDAAILEFISADWQRLLPIVQTIYQEQQAWFQPETPFFCKPLALGLGLAEKPMGTDVESINLGQQHCSIIAQALMNFYGYGDRPNTDKLDYVHHYLSQTGVDLERLYLNLNSHSSYEAEFLLS